MIKALLSYFLLSLCLSTIIRAQQRTVGWWSPPVLSQLPDIDSIATRHPARHTLFDFEHTLSLYRWGASIYATSSPLLDKPTISLAAEGRSRLRQDTRIRTSEAGASLSADYPLAEPSTSLIVAFTATSYSQEQRATTTLANIAKLSSINDGAFSFGGRHQFGNYLQAEAYGGLTVKGIEERESVGPLAKMRLVLAPYQLDEDHSISGNSYLDERTYNATDEVFRNDGASLILSSRFADGGLNTARAGFALKRRDFFFPRDTSQDLVRQERSEFIFEAGDDFYYPIIGNDLTAALSFDIAPRNVSRRAPGVDLASLRSQFLTGTTVLAPSSSSMTSSNIRGNLRYQFPTGSLESEIRYNERSETNTLRFDEATALGPTLSKKVADALSATSFTAQSTTAALRAYKDLSSSDVVSVDLNARIYRYDTPSEENVDDRDEQYLYATIRYGHSFSALFDYQTEVRIARGHLVYLESDRSAQNNTTRSVAFYNKVGFTSSSVRNVLSAEVFANYTEYDFLLPSLLATNDFVIRGVSATDSLYISLANDPIATQWGLGLRGELRHSERGSFHADAFAERPLLETSELLAESLLHCAITRTSAPVLVRVGVRSFILYRRFALTTHTAQGLRDDERSTRIGPIGMITLDNTSSRGLRLFGSLWYGFVTTHRFSDRVTTYGNQVEARLAAEWQF